jgi:hypothetical protein
MRSKDTTHAKIKLPTNSMIKGLERTQQVAKVSDYVFMVKVN